VSRWSPSRASTSTLVWGDPALYDSTLAVVEDILARGEIAFEYAVVPGVSSVATLAARHRVALNRVGRPFVVTTGRRLAEGWPSGVDDVVVMLDAQCAFALYAAEDITIYWVPTPARPTRS
jgi:precorrin-6A synthase